MHPEEIPSLVWFLSPNDLVKLLTRTSDSKLVAAFARHDLKTKLEPLWKIRNHWAHFRPYPPIPAYNELTSVVDVLVKTVAPWTAEYWNALDSCEDEPEWQRLATQLRENPEYSEVIPVRTTPIPGYHGGFLDAHSEDDRGLELFVQMNESREVLWIRPTTVGGSDYFGLQDIREYARRLGESAVHIAMNFEEGEVVEDVEEDGFSSLRISLSLKDSEKSLLQTLKVISEVTKERGFRPQRMPPESETGCCLTREHALDRLYYATPWNVIVAPTQEGRLSWPIHLKER